MIAYRDFKLSFFSLMTLDGLMPAVSQWVEDTKVKVINCETLYTLGGTSARSESGVRVWYTD